MADDINNEEEVSNNNPDNVEVSGVDDDMLADMLDQASDDEEDTGSSTEGAVSSSDLDDDMLADMLDQASDVEEDTVSTSDLDDDMLADMLDQASDDEEVKEQALDSEGNPMDDEMAALWGDAMGEQEAESSPLEHADPAQAFASGSPVKKDAVDYNPVNMPDLSNELGGQLNLDIIMDVPITISMEVGRTMVPIRNLLQLNQGSVIELNRLAGEALDVMVNGCLIAHGEVVVVNDKFGIRLTDIVSVDERVRKIKV